MSPCILNAGTGGGELRPWSKVPRYLLEGQMGPTAGMTQ
jgi:hypothetical protein